jgi:GDP/UDP-N,N'-diacetylbacillosamine 2-epimerase (hydrolysing)
MAGNKLKKYLFFFDSRATFAYSNNVIKFFKKKRIKYNTLISGNYLEKEMRIDKKIFQKNKLNISAISKFNSPNNKPESWPISFGKAMIKYAKIISRIKPDITIITGDRIETLSFCITCAYMNVPIAHIQAGDQSGHIDDIARAAIAKFSNIHFAPSINARKRLINWGENKKRIFFTGAPQLDDININKNVKKKNFYIVIFHPILNEQKNLHQQIDALLKAIKKTGIDVLWIYPNNDSGYKQILKKINITKNKNISVVSNYERSEFVKLLHQSSGIIGNSSCGIIEASLFKIPAINIGNRQNGRPQSCNIINCKPEMQSIINSINFIRKNKNFKTSLKKVKNPFYKKKSSQIISKILINLKKDNKLLTKY